MTLETEHYSSLTAVSKRGYKQPLYVVHGAGGGILFLQEFARLLEGTRKVCGFRAHGLDGEVPPDQDVDAMASRYVAELCAHAPGPYLLGGYSSGGTIALEMAAKLKQLGHEVTRVLLFDCWPTGDDTQPWALRHLRLASYLLTEGYDPVRPFVQFIAGNRIGRMFGSRAATAALTEPVRDDVDAFFHRTVEMLSKHQFKRYDVDTVLIKADLNWPALPRDYEWSPLLVRPLVTRIAQGHHITMWWPENAPALVALVEELLGDPTGLP